MKKIFFCLVMALMAVCAQAQVTWNVRAGVGGQEGLVYETGGHLGYHFHAGATLTVESNIPFRKGSSFTYSPSLSVFSQVTDNRFRIMLPLHVGYKMYLSDKLMFCPKLGLTLAYDINYANSGYGGYHSSDYYENNKFKIGPSIELPFEYKHFIVALQVQTLFAGRMQTGGSLTFGYKFY